MTEQDKVWADCPWTDSQFEDILNGIADDPNGMTLYTAVNYLRTARLTDPTDSYYAAEIRDAIRDNFDPACDDEDPALWNEVNR